MAGPEHEKYVDTILDTIAEAAKVRGTGIAKRTHEYLTKKMLEAKAVIALTKDGRFAGFSYIESWGHSKFVANSGLIVRPEYRKSGLARRIKHAIFELSRKKFPDAKIFGITTSAAVMKINNELGYRPVTFGELTDDETYWQGCASCCNYDILLRNNKTKCLCTGMLYDPAEHRAFGHLKKSISKFFHPSKD